MPEFVYALHDFVAEHEDEIPFRAGESIEIIERDDEFGDGWWQGRNLAGKTGLFPQNYTTSSPPFPMSASNLSQFSNAPSEPPAIALSVPGAPEGSSQMAQTLGDVQEALDQLGAGSRLTPHDADRGSVSIASGTDDESELEADPESARNWGNRQLLAESARRELAERRIREMREAQAPIPIPLAMSDDSESEGEGDAREEDEREGAQAAVNGLASQRTSFQPDTPRLGAPFGGTGQIGNTRPLETHSRQGSAAGSLASLPIPAPNAFPAHMTVLSMDQAPEQSSPVSPPTATSITAILEIPTQEIEEPTPRLGDFNRTRIEGAQIPLPVSPPPQEGLAGLLPSFTTIPPPPGNVLSSMPRAPAIVAPREPPPVPLPTVVAASALAPPFLESSVTSNSSYGPETYAAPMPSPPLAPPPTSPMPAIAPSDHPADPNTWSTSDVLAWLSAKGFDSTIRDKFEEQDITGDVLLSLDMALLKDELGITVFGKRVRLNNAINELRKSVAPPAPAAAALGPATPAGTLGGSPGQGQDTTPANGQTIPHGLVLSPESAPKTNEMNPLEWTTPSLTGATTAMQTPSSKTDELVAAAGLSGTALVGLGLGSLNRERPSYPSFGGSDGTGSVRGKRSTLGSIDPNFIPEEDETREGIETYEADRGSIATSRHQLTAEPGATETETTSAPDSLKHSQAKDTPPSSIPPSPSKRASVDSPSSAFPTVAVRRSGSANGLKTKKQMESQKDSRLSFFSGSLGKNRKPAPRYSGDGLPSDSSPTTATSAVSEKRSLARYLSGSTHRKTPSVQSNVRHSSGTGSISISSPIPNTTSPTSETSHEASPNVLRKRLSSSPGQSDVRYSVNGATGGPAMGPTSPITEKTENALEKIGIPDHQGWMRKKGERYSSWKNRYFVLKDTHLYYLRSQTESKIKGYINVTGYKVIADENANVGKYGFRIVHETEKPHYFSSDEQVVIREWMKAIMKATIGRDYSKPVISSCHIPTIPLAVAQAMSPAPRPPSPGQREATQRALRPSNPDKLSDRDAAVLMLAVKGQDRPGDERLRARVESVFTVASADSNDFREARIAEPASPVPPRPNRETRFPRAKKLSAHDQELLDWVNANLPVSTPKSTDLAHSFASGLVLFRLVEKLSGKVQGVPDALFMASLDSEDSFEGLFKLFDIMVENGISTADVSMSDVHTGDTKSIVQLVQSVKRWNDAR
ncbi:hypothetical protein DACRYDRAFT_113317 [Dacryopinax primogenitus]|uniref:PH-domain-containing protein n=1 Tax=Dacryopinax primogenitus (strain DJM 731) TaxID=1858805 RepID=M5G8Z1_DACPD|nr:uncharacterized protein DACRYDRAFT_113317 [Dacryopinax primogenitus]EJU06671.1 hypothetical protein DACRYDRAFT_113317 [Dacryopinax primogenitus]